MTGELTARSFFFKLNTLTSLRTSPLFGFTAVKPCCQFVNTRVPSRATTGTE